ncbi:extracellular solute-binding protein [Sneathiella sp. HT1-7]|uniref:extracellular solute-binding protein n=1 Tax=Sneathiella sp. HT1-7 TaxID=2887192 RepID=UPI001D132953|nr:extracellular solute-binding protein [Sneathiella sp. HT1-7]MCC3304103.1 extracellular solute-binding protein [Sneathiella sp. HT1-7]
MKKHSSLLLFLIALFFGCAGPAQAAEKHHAIAMHGEPKYPAGFLHFDYVNPGSPIGGTLRLSDIGSFDSLNPFLLKGVTPRGLSDVYQTLLERSRDEPFTLYANIAEAIEVAPDRSWIAFHINPKARFSNGTPITAEDVLSSYETLREQGRPNVQLYYRKVTKADILSPLSVRFAFEEEGRFEMPLIMGLMSVLPKSELLETSFDKTSLTPLIGSGPYLVEKIEPGRRIIYRRNENFWGWHLPQNKGRHNFGRIIYDYFRDDDVALEAFKSHNIDARFESNAAKWTASYGWQSGAEYKRSTPKLSIPAPMLAFVFNTRHKKFADLRVRKALTHAFDFEWVNANILHSLYKRTHSFFENSPLAAKGIIKDAERDVLSPFADELPEAVFNDAFSLPKTDGSGRARVNLKIARQLLLSAGYKIKDGILTHQETGRPFEIEFLINNTDYVKMISPFQRNLELLGIQSNIRQIDTASYQNRLTEYEFDIIINSWGQSLSPGNEQAFYWSRNAAETPGTRNYPAIRLAAVDAMIEQIATAQDRATLVNAARALDRVLLNGHYVIPLYYTDEKWLAHWPEIKLPAVPSYWGTSADLWWYEKDS